MYLSCPFFSQSTTSHALTPTQLQTYSTYTPVHKPQHRLPAVLCAGMRGIDAECLRVFFPSSYLCWLQSRHTVPTCVPKWSMSTISRLCKRLNLLQRISGISVTQCLLLLFLPNPVHPQACTLFTQRHGGWTPFTHREERKQRWDTGKKSSTDKQTRVSVWAQTAEEVRLFLELQRIHLMNLHYWDSFRVST